MTDVTVGIVLYNSERYIARCLDSLLGQTLTPSRVFCVDNACADGAADIARRHPIGPTVIVNRENVGFARAQNQMIRAAGGEFYLALNPDLFLEPRYIENVAAALEADKAAGWAQGKILFEGGPPDVIYSAGHVMFSDYHAENRGYGRVDDGAYEKQEEIFGANGAAAFYRRRMLESIAVQGEYYDELFFLYWDDVDLDVRANAAGWHCLFVPTARARHVGAASGGPRMDRVKVEQRKNRYLSVLKNRGVAGLASALAAGFPKNAFWFTTEAIFSPMIYLKVIAGTLRQLGPAMAKRREILRLLEEARRREGV